MPISETQTKATLRWPCVYKYIIFCNRQISYMYIFCTVDLYGKQYFVNRISLQIGVI